MYSFSQTHTFDARCRHCKDCTIRECENSCPGCIAEFKKEMIDSQNKEKARKLLALENHNKQLNDEKNFIEKQKEEEEQRNLIASAKINNANSEIDALNKIKEQQSFNLKNAEDKYKHECEKVNTENDLFLKQLRNSSKTTSLNNKESFWNETLSPEKLFKFEIKDEKGHSIYGFKNEKGTVKIEAKFYSAEEFINGYAKAEIFIKGDEIYEHDRYWSYYSAGFWYVERGVIGKNGAWVKPCQKILLYSFGERPKLYLTKVNDDDYKLTRKEKEAKEREYEKWKLEEDQKAKIKYEDILEKILAQAKNEGYIIEKR